MRKIEVKLYKFSELSEDAKKKALEKLYDINVDYEWWEWCYEDAKNIGLKITGFDLDRSRHCDGEIIADSYPECAEKIMEEHGKETETYKTAKEFLETIEAIRNEHENVEDTDEDKIEDAEKEFLDSLLEDYAIILQKEYEYKTSEEAIIETIEANEYEFTEDGKLN